LTVPRLDIDPFDEAFLADPYAHHAALRDMGAVVWLEPIQCYAMARFAEVQAALNDWETYVSGRGVGFADFAREEPWRPPSLLLEADPPVHDRTRTLMNRIVSLRSLKEVFPEWQRKSDRLVDALVKKQRFDAVEDLGAAFPLSVFPDLIGLEDEGRENLIVYGTGVFNGFGPRNAVLERSLAETATAGAWVAQACKRERLKPGGWGMQVYEASDAGACTPEEAERLVRSFLSAGVDTTVNGIANMIHAFVSYPDQWQRLRAEPALARKAFEESLRWDGTVQTFFRTTSRRVNVSDTTIPEGSKVTLFLAAANRDPRHWERADTFDITRSASGHVGFGFGIHQCLGQMVARMEAEAVLAALIPRVKEIRRAGEPVRRINNTLHALAALPVEVIPC
jgi:cytochrome P450